LDDDLFLSWRCFNVHIQAIIGLSHKSLFFQCIWCIGK
jgi:hypothetical protein